MGLERIHMLLNESLHGAIFLGTRLRGSKKVWGLEGGGGFAACFS